MQYISTVEQFLKDNINKCQVTNVKLLCLQLIKINVKLHFADLG